MVNISAQRDTTHGSFVYESSNLRFSSPLFAALARACAHDTDMCELGSVVRPGQPIAMFILLTAQYLLFRSPDAPVAAYFPSLSTAPRAPEAAFPAFREFCLDRREQLLHLLSTRTVNTNLVERASSVLPASRYVAKLINEPLTLVEICCSAGLNLLFDEYHYDYGAAGQVGNPQSKVRLSTKVLGSGRPPIEQIPQVRERVGIDLVTWDCTDPDTRTWMEAMLFPEWHAERARLRAALEVQALRQVRTVRGDAVAALPQVLQALSGPVMVMHSFCMGQWLAAAEAELDEIFRHASLHRDVHRIAMEASDAESPETIRARLAALSAAQIPIQQKCLAARIEHTRYVKGDRGHTHFLGHTDGMGSWIDWRTTH